jgi:hypothetical protein
MSNKLNIELKQGEDFYRLITLKDENGLVINLTGHTFAGQIRTSYKDEVFLSFSFTLLDQTTNTGEFELTLAKELSSAKSLRNKSVMVYDIEHNTGSRTYRLLEGQLIFSPEVTR